MKSRFIKITIMLALFVIPILVFAQDADHAGEGAPQSRQPDSVAMQMLVLPILIVVVLIFNAFRKRK